MTPDLLPGRMAAKVRVAESGCWLWTGAIQSSGYGCVGVGGHVRLAHRVAYELLVGPIPSGLQIDHLCRVRNCIAPTHLQPVTGGENVRRAKAQITECPKGHPYAGTNVLINKRGQRSCRACNVAGVRAYRERQRVT